MKHVTKGKKPFAHWVVDDAFPDSLIDAALAEWPAEDWPHWHYYNDKNAKKRTTKDVDRLTPASRELFNMLARLDIVRDLQGLDVKGVFPDLTAYGAGMHWIPKGGSLGIHLDAAAHPLTGWRRRLSATLCLTTDPHGGSLELCGPDKQSVQSVESRRNRLSIFECTDASWHGVTKPVTLEDGRKLITMFYWSLPEPGEDAPARQAAQFD